MISVFNLIFSLAIDNKRYLGFDEAGQVVQERFSFFTANKCASDGRFYEVDKGNGKSQLAYYNCMHDHATQDIYIVHPVELLPKYFVVAGLGAIPLTVFTVAWNVARVVAIAINAVFEVFQTLYPARDTKDIAKEFVNDLKIKINEKSLEIKNCLEWVKSSLEFGLAIEAAALNALLNWKEEQTLFEMKVVIARIEFLWNRGRDFRQSRWNYRIDCPHFGLAQLGHSIRDKAYQLTNGFKINWVGLVCEFVEFAKQANWSQFFSINYMMPCFQSRGFKDATVLVSVEVKEKSAKGFTETLKTKVLTQPMFRVIAGSEKKTYQEYAAYLDKLNPSWRIGELTYDAVE